MSDSTAPKQTLIAKGTAFKGDFNSECPILVNGHIEGKMSAPSLTVSATGSVKGIVKVNELHSEGEISGEYTADFVRLSGSVKDNTVIRAKSLEVKLNNDRGKFEIVFGECQLDVGDIPDKQAAVAASEAAGASEPIAEPVTDDEETPESNGGADAGDADSSESAEGDATPESDSASEDSPPSAEKTTDAAAPEESEDSSSGRNKRGRRKRTSARPGRS